jgi:hypothetical protein
MKIFMIVMAVVLLATFVLVVLPLAALKELKVNSKNSLR